MADQVRHDRRQARDDGKPVRNDRLMKSNEVLKRAMQISCDPMLYNIMGKNYQAMQQYDLAEEYLLKSTHIVPNRLYPHYLLMKLYVETGEEEKARKAAATVLTKEPKVQSTAVREMREEAEKLKVNQKLKTFLKELRFYVILIVVAILLATAMRVFLYTSIIKIPSGSMESAVTTGDFIIAGKQTPGPRVFEDLRQFRIDIERFTHR